MAQGRSAAGGEPLADRELELSLLGAALVSPAVLDVVHVEAGDFYWHQHGTLWRAICAVDARGARPDVPTVRAELRATTTFAGEPGAGEHAVSDELLNEVVAAPPSLSNLADYAGGVADLARRRRAVVAAERVVHERGGAEAVAALSNLTPPASTRRVVAGGAFVLDTDDGAVAEWGEADRVLHPQGEGLVIAASPGLGKTTTAQQVVLHRHGIRTGTLLGLPVRRSVGRTLLLCMDRPAQARRSLARMVDDSHRELLDRHVAVWPGPLPFDTIGAPELLSRFARQHDCDLVVIDSAKDIALSLSDSEVGARFNAAIQTCLADGVEVIVLHHLRKPQPGVPRVRTLDDLHGSAWIAAGAGSVVLLEGQAGDPIVRMRHVKQPMAEVGPFDLRHDHDAGVTTVVEQADLYELLRRQPGMTVRDAARLLFGNDNPRAADREKARRQLERLRGQGRARREDTDTGATYTAIETLRAAA